MRSQIQQTTPAYSRAWVAAGAIFAATLFAASSGCAHGQVPAAERKTVPAAQQAAAPASPAADQKQVKSPSAKVEQEAESEGVANDATHQGVKVHGHWIVTIKNPDGSQVSRTEFENSLVGGGGDALSTMLYMTSVPAGFAISMTGSTPAPCSASTCVLVADVSKAPSGECIGSSLCTAGLTTILDPTNNTVTLSGQMTASVAGTISQVGTDIFLCNNGSFPMNLSPAACIAQGLSRAQAFTRRFMSGISVASGQIVQVQVTLSFS